MTNRVGIIGCGQMGQRRASSILACGDVVSWVYDTDPDRSAALARACGARCAGTAGELVAAADLVVVATANASLAGYVQLCADRRVPVLVEKPGAVSSGQLKQLVLAAGSAGVTVQVGYSLPHYDEVRAFLRAAGDIGDLTFLRACYGHGGRPQMATEWRADPRFSGGGELLDQGVHLIQLAISLLGEVKDVKCILSSAAWALGVEDTAFLLLTHERGSASLTVSWAFWKNEFRLDATSARGSIHLNGLGGSYGEGRLMVHLRRPELAGPPVSAESVVPAGPALETEWRDFTGRATAGHPGNGSLAVSVLRVVEKARADAAG